MRSGKQIGSDAMETLGVTEYLAYKDRFVRIAVTELKRGHFAWEYQVDGGNVYVDRARPRPSAVMALKTAVMAAKAHIDQTMACMAYRD